MEGVRLQSILYSGYAKAALRLGVPYAQYRSSTHLLPIAAGNLLRSLPVAFSADLKFEVPNKYATPTWLLWADGSLLAQFDFLVGPFGTFFVGSLQPTLPIQAVQTDKVVSLGRVGYSSSGPLVGSHVNYATGLPVLMQYKREEIKPSPFANAIGEAITRWLVFIPLPNGLVKQDDIMMDEEGIRYIVDAPDFTGVGYVAGVRKADV